MIANLLAGNTLADLRISTLKEAVTSLQAQNKPVPGLAVILVNGDPASEIYVKNKRKRCLEVGFNSFDFDLPESTTTEYLLNLIQDLNLDKRVHGILVQLPLPKHISAQRILEALSPKKDVDGFHPYNVGRLAIAKPLLRPCTPYGIIQLLNFYELNLRGKHAVIVGASNIVGRPMALEFLLAGLTITVCHRLTQDLEKHIRMADVIVSATGVPDLISTEWLDKKQILIDVGIHRLPNGKLRGDIDFESAKNKVAWITPVPGGVGPMTIATLLSNTLLASQIASGEHFD